jgi:carboxypeptidase family protein
VTTVSGVLTDTNGAPLADGTVIVFSTESDKWSDASRFVRSARPDQQGKYQIKGLPPGEYLALAIDYVQDGMWNDPEYLESLRGRAQHFTLGETETRTVGLKLATVENP